MELRVVIAAGGTGGHLFPGIAVAQEFQERHQAAVTFLTTPKPVTTQDSGELRLRLGGRLRPGLERRGPPEPRPHPAGDAESRACGPGPAQSSQTPPGPGHGRPFLRDPWAWRPGFWAFPWRFTNRTPFPGPPTASCPGWPPKSSCPFPPARIFFPRGAASGPAIPSGRSFLSLARPGRTRPSRC